MTSAPTPASQVVAAATTKTGARSNDAPRSSARTQMDPNTFPHIIDLIIEHAPRASLIALRAASQAFRARVDPELSLSIFIVGQSGVNGVAGPCGRIPALAPHNMAWFEERKRIRQFGQCPWPAPSEAVRVALAGVRVITLDGHEDRGEWVMETLQRYLPKLETVRLVQNDRLPPTDRLGLYHVDRPSHCVVFAHTRTAHPAPHLTPACITQMGPYFLPRSTRRLVLNIAYGRLQACTAQFVKLGGLWLRDLEEVVVIFVHKPNGRGGDRAAAGNRGERRVVTPPSNAVDPLGSVWDFLRYCRLCSLKLELVTTIDDLPEVHPSLLGVPNATEDHVHSEIIRRIAGGVEGLTDEEYCRCLEEYSSRLDEDNRLSEEDQPSMYCSRFVFFTSDEYREQVGEVRWETETVLRVPTPYDYA